MRFVRASVLSSPLCLVYLQSAGCCWLALRLNSSSKKFLSGLVQKIQCWNSGRRCKVQKIQCWNPGRHRQMRIAEQSDMPSKLSPKSKNFCAVISIKLSHSPARIKWFYEKKKPQKNIRKEFSRRQCVRTYRIRVYNL